MTNCKRPLHVTPSGHPLWRGWHPPTHRRPGKPSPLICARGYKRTARVFFRVYFFSNKDPSLPAAARKSRERARRVRDEPQHCPPYRRCPAHHITANPALRAPGGLSHNSLPRPLGASAHLHPEGLTCVRQWPWSSVMLCCSHTPPSHPCAARPQRPPSFHAAGITPRIVG